MVPTEVVVFRDRAAAAGQLAAALAGRPFRSPLVLAVPRGGVVTGAVLARGLGADLDVALSRKLRAPDNPELALGAVAEDGSVFLNRDVLAALAPPPGYLERERRAQFAEIERRRMLFRGGRPPARATGRSVIVTDDGIATGATVIAALQAVRGQHPRELIAAVPVAAPDRLAEVRRWCDEVVCLQSPGDFSAVGQYYEDFTQVEDAEVVALLRGAAPAGNG